MKRIVRAGIVLLVMAAVMTWRPSPAPAEHPSPKSSPAFAVGQAMLAEPSRLVTATTTAGTSAGDPRGYVTSTVLGNFMPTNGSTFGLLSTGVADDASQANAEENLSTQLSGSNTNAGRDLTRLTLTMTAPPGANCMSFDFSFYSEEFPEFVDSPFNDAFVAELDKSEITVSITGTITAPRNFVFDTDGKLITVNNNFRVTAANADGTTYDGATPLLRAQTNIDGTKPVVLILSIFDVGDSIYDSTVFVDNINMFFASVPCPKSTQLQGGQKPQPCLGPTWYFAEGTTRPGFDEYLLLFNPLDTDATVAVDYLFADGSPKDTKTYNLPKTSRQTIAVWEQVGRGKDVSMRVAATLKGTATPAPIATERSMFFNFPGSPLPGLPDQINGTHAVRGEPRPFPEFYFGEGTTLPGFDEYITIQNTGPKQKIDVEYAKSDGTTKVVTVEPEADARITLQVFDANEGVGRGVEGVAARVTARDHGILAERPMYFRNGFGDATGQIISNGGHVDFGNVPTQQWYFAEGTVLPGWFMYLTLYNPYTFPITTTITYLLEGQASIPKNLVMPKTSRLTIKVFDSTDPFGIGRNVSDPVSRGVAVNVSTVQPQGIVVERPMYFDYSFPDIGQLSGGTDKSGSRLLKKTWYFSEGTTRTNFDYFLTFQNPNLTSTATLNMRYFLTDGSVVARTATLAPASRTTVQTWAGDQVGKGALGMREKDYGLEIKSDQLILVERPAYVNHEFPDIGRVQGGSVVFGLPDPCI